jgi:YidC/Oxa1 family membrane protein insertase
MPDALYTLFIFPIELLVELSYLFVFRVFHNPALSILGVSFAVSLFTLPLYFRAEKHQKSERDKQKQMKPEVDNIKAVFSGDERFMRLSVYYRQNRYHPLYSLRSSISLIIQIPFFIAAYHFLSNLEMIKGVSFGPIMDLGKPDSLLSIKSVSVNILPVAMTLVNCASAVIYSKGFSVRDKIQLYGMSALFLVLLYSSPSALVLYWTGNNLFSLLKT